MQSPEYDRKKSGKLSEKDIPVSLKVKINWRN